MNRKHPPHKMLSLLVVLLAMLSYFTIDLYTHEQSSSKSGSHGSGNTIIAPKIDQVPPIENKNSAPNKDVAGSRPENNVISPGAKISMEKHYLNCGHAITNEINAPANIVNLTEQQLKLAYTGWVIQKFTPLEVVISQDVNSKCPYHYILKEKDGYVAVYYQTPINSISLKEVTPILVSNLKSEDQENIKAGIKIESQQDLAQRLEDLGS
jgi:hypothetical protein